MSFALTTDQIRARTKTVTRRLGWEFLEPGDLVQAVVKGMGLRKGEKVEKLGVLRVVSKERLPLNEITPLDVLAEGFPGKSTRDFVAMFCEHNRAKKVRPDTIVTRIEFAYVEPQC